MAELPDGVVLLRQEPMSRHSPWRVGGQCEAWMVVHRRAALAGTLAYCKAENWKAVPIGAATRVVFGEAGIPPLLRLGTDFSGIEVEDGKLRVGAAVPIPALLAAAAALALGGLEDLVRQPGSVGAALKLDEGPWLDHVREVTVFSRGAERAVGVSDARRGKAIVTGALFELPGRTDELNHRIRASLGGRRANESRPLPGCWWKPLERRPLRGALLKAGLAGVRLRGVVIPVAAPDTFANLGGGTVEDLALLQRSAIDRVKRDSGETLVPRLRTLGRAREDPMIDKALRVGVLMGGLSTEHAVSMKSGKAVAAALRNRGWNAIDIVVDRTLPAKLVEQRIDVAWIALHGRFGEDGCVQGLLEVMGIPYTGCGVLASSVAMDKIATKRALAGDQAVTMAADWVFRKGQAWPSDITLPVVVKPSIGGSTLGISIAKTETELRDAVDAALRLDDEVLLEAYVEGDEITVAVLDGRPLPIVRILPDSGFFDFEAKYTEGRTTYEVPADISEDAWRKASAAAKVAFVRLGCRGLCRADFIIRESDDEPVFLEINTIPGMTATSLSPMAAASEGISFEELVERILKSAVVMVAEIEGV